MSEHWPGSARLDLAYLTRWGGGDEAGDDREVLRAVDELGGGAADPVRLAVVESHQAVRNHSARQKYKKTKRQKDKKGASNQRSSPV